MKTIKKCLIGIVLMIFAAHFSYLFYTLPIQLISEPYYKSYFWLGSGSPSSIIIGFIFLLGSYKYVCHIQRDNVSVSTPRTFFREILLIPILPFLSKYSWVLKIQEPSHPIRVFATLSPDFDSVGVEVISNGAHFQVKANIEANRESFSEFLNTDKADSLVRGLIVPDWVDGETSGVIYEHYKRGGAFDQSKQFNKGDWLPLGMGHSAVYLGSK